MFISMYEYATVLWTVLRRFLKIHHFAQGKKTLHEKFKNSCLNKQKPNCSWKIEIICFLLVEAYTESKCVWTVYKYIDVTAC